MLRNNVNLVGRLTKEIEIKKTNSGKEVTTFSLAVNDKKVNDQQVSFFFNIVAWEQCARYFKQYAGKGDLIGVNGRLTTRSYQNTRGDKVTVTEIVADDVMLLNKAKQQQTTNQQQATNQNTNLFYNAYQEQKSYAQSQLANEQYVDATIEFDSDDLPF